MRANFELVHSQAQNFLSQQPPRVTAHMCVGVYVLARRATRVMELRWSADVCAVYPFSAASPETNFPPVAPQPKI
jgi:hypothetical protein